MNSLGPVIWWANVAALALASAIDIRKRRIPNWLALPFLACGLGVQVAAGGWRGAQQALAGAAVGCACFIVPCWLRAMGMGDLKLAAGVGAWMGPGQAFVAMVLTALAGGLLAAGFAARNRTLGASLDRTGNVLSGLSQGRPRRPTGEAASLSIPYAPAIAVGALASFLTR
jgi:prepilin peptidase CpaA